jgi:hypothetical protein
VEITEEPDCEQSKELLQELQGRNPHETAGLLAAFAGGWTPSGSCRSRIFAQPAADVNIYRVRAFGRSSWHFVLTHSLRQHLASSPDTGIEAHLVVFRLVDANVLPLGGVHSRAACGQTNAFVGL